MEDKKQNPKVNVGENEDGVPEYSFEVKGDLPEAETLPPGSEEWEQKSDEQVCKTCPIPCPQKKCDFYVFIQWLQFLMDWFTNTDNGFRDNQAESSFNRWEGLRDEEGGESEFIRNITPSHSSKAEEKSSNQSGK
jgi:hypothetical protein